MAACRHAAIPPSRKNELQKLVARVLS
jgi:hypothetical protein